MDPAVGDNECTFLDVCNLLRGSPSFETLVSKLVEVARNLQLPGEEVHKIKLQLNKETISYHDALWDILVSWRSKFSYEAKLSALVGVLRTCDIADAADKLEMHFKTRHRRIATYSCPPDGMIKFLDSNRSILVIRSMDKHVTATKLMDYGSITHMHDHIDFAQNLLASESRNQVYSVACNNEYTLSEMLGLIDPIIQCRAVVITEEKLEKVQELCSGKTHVMVTRDTLKWSHLSPARKLSVPLNLVKASGKVMRFRDVAKVANVWDKLDESLDEHTLLGLVYDRQPSILVKSIPAPINYYVSRRVSSRTLLRPDEIFLKKIDAKGRDDRFTMGETVEVESNDGKDVFVFNGIQRSELTRYARPNSTDTTTSQKRMDHPNIKYMVLDMKSDFDELAEKIKGSLHWIEHKDGKFYWVKSARGTTAGDNKTLDTIHKAIDKRSAQEEYSEEGFLESLLQRQDTCDLPVLISDTPGMGKTMLLANLARQLEEKGDVVVFGVMSNLVKKLKTKLKGGHEMKMAIVDLLSSLGGGTSPLSREYVKSSLISNSSSSPEINVMLDGFDEVPSLDFELAGKILQVIRSDIMARLWVSTRPHLLEGVENCLQVLGHNILAFNSEDQRECLVGYWKDGDRCLLKTKLHEFAESCLQTLHTSMSSSDHDIAGVPLQCMFIGELYEREARNYAKPDNLTSKLPIPSIDIRSVTDLYMRLMEKKLDNYFERYSSSKYLREELKLAHIFFCIQELFPVWTDELDEILRPGLKVQLEDVLNVGLLEMVGEEGLPEFIHRTIAEFFVAYFVFHYLIQKVRVTKEKRDEACQSFVCSVLEFEEFRLDLSRIPPNVPVQTRHDTSHTYNLHSYKFIHRVVLYFLDNLIQPQTKHKLELNLEPKKLTHACVAGNLNRLFDYLLSMHILQDNLGDRFWDRNLVFTSVCYSNIQLISTICKMHEHIYASIPRGLLMPLSDNNGITLIDVAVSCREYSVVEHLISCQGFKDLVENHDESVKNVIHYCVRNSLRNDAALIAEKIQILKLLYELNPLLIENKNDEGMTPLLCSHVHIALLCELIRQGANVLDVDEDEENLLHKAARYLSPEDCHELMTHVSRDSLSKLVHGYTDDEGKTPLLEIMTCSDPDNRTLQLFKYVGADYNAVDDYGDSVIEMAVKGNRSIGTIEQLISHGAEWQDITPSGWSVLHFALLYTNFPVFQHFALKLTEDPNIQQLLRDAEDWPGLANLNVQTLGLNLNAKDDEGNTILHTLVDSSGDKTLEAVISIVIQSGADLRATDSTGSTACDLALLKLSKANGYYQQNACFSLLDLLLSQGATNSPSSAYDSIKTLLQNVTTSIDYIELIDIVIERIALATPFPTTDANGDTFLHHAVYANNNGGVQYLLDKQVDVNERNIRGETPAHKVLSLSEDPDKDYPTMITHHTDIIQLLAEHEADMAAADNDGRTPLSIAIENKQGRAVEFLFSTGAYDDLEMLHRVLHRCDHDCLLSEDFKNYGTLLHVAARSSKLSIFEFLFHEEGFGDLMQTDSRMNNIVHTVVRDTERNEHVDVQIEMLRMITCKNPALIYSYDSKNETPAFCLSVHADLLIWLLGNGVDPKVVNACKQSMLHVSANLLMGHPSQFLKLVDWMVQHGFEELLKTEDINQNTPFHAVVRDLNLNEQAIEVALKYIDINESNSKGENLLFKAVEGKRSVPFLLRLISKGADWKKTSNSLQTLIHVAALHYSKLDTLELLLNALSVNDKDKLGREPIHYAAAAGNINALKLFIEKGCDVNVRDNDGRTPIHIVVKLLQGVWQHVLEFLIAKGPGLRVVYAKDNEGRNMLHIAAESRKHNEYHAVLEWVVHNSYEKLFMERSNNQNTPLHSAVWYMDIEDRALQLLLKYSDINDTDIDGNNTLFKAIQGNTSDDFINLLITKGAEWQNRNNNQDNVLHIAATWGSVNALRFFIEKGCDVNAKNQDDETPLHCAFKGKRARDRNNDAKIQASTYDMVKLLLANNADMEAKDSEGRTPIGVAIEKLEFGKVSSITIELMELTA